MRLVSGFGVSDSHFDSVFACSSIGHVYEQLGEHETSLEYFRAALQISKNLPGGIFQLLISLLYAGISRIYINMGNFSEAKIISAQSLEILDTAAKSISSEDKPMISVIHLTAGDLFYRTGRYEDALKHLNCSKQLHEELYGANNIRAAIIYCQLGKIYSSLEQFEQAQTYFNKSLAIHMDTNGTEANNPLIADVNSHIGNVLLKLGDHKTASTYFLKSLTMNKAIYGLEVNYPAIVKRYSEIGNVHYDSGKYAEALEWCQKSLAMAQAKYGLGSNHQNIAVCYTNIGNVEHKLGNPREALEWHLKSLKMLQEVYGPEADHPYMATCLSSIAGSYADDGDNDRALDYYSKSLEMFTTVYQGNTSHSDIEKIYQHIATVYHNMGNYHESLRYSIKLAKLLLINSHESKQHMTAKCYKLISKLLDKMGHHRSARTYYQKAEEYVQ